MIRLLLFFLLSLAPKQWIDNTFLGQTVKLHSLTGRQDGLYFDFPGLSNPKDGIDYLRTPDGTAPSLGNSPSITVTYSIQTTGTPVFLGDTESFNTCPATAHVRVWLAHQNWWLDPDSQYKRWWANPVALELTGAGQFSMTVPLDPAGFSSVYGAFANQDATTLQYFNETLLNPSSVGLSFGSNCFFGHGVYVTGGTARFTLLQYQVN